MKFFPLLFDADKHNKRNQMRTKKRKMSFKKKTLGNIDVEKTRSCRSIKEAVNVDHTTRFYNKLKWTYIHICWYVHILYVYSYNTNCDSSVILFALTRFLLS